MKTALLILQLVSGHEVEITVDRQLCIEMVEKVRSGEQSTLEDEAGVLWEIEMAKCLVEPETLRVPLS